MNYGARIERLRARLKEMGLEGFIVNSNANRFYLTGFSGSAGWVLITSREIFLFVDGRYKEQAKQECPSFVKQIEVSQSLDSPVPLEVLATLKELSMGRIGFESDHLTFEKYSIFNNEFKDEQLIPCHGLIAEMRMIKEFEEIQLIKEALLMAEEALHFAFTRLKAGITEVDLAAEILYFLKKHGAEREAFDTIIGSGNRSALPHARPSSKVIDEGDLVVIDLGALFKGYNSDLTRTVVVGKPSTVAEEMFQLVIKAQEAAFRQMKPGVPCSQIDALARETIREGGYGEYFSHNLGHGIGLEVHEYPRLKEGNDQQLEEGMVVTVEPGIYLPDVGGVRIEDMVLITADGIEVLTHATKSLCF